MVLKRLFNLEGQTSAVHAREREPNQEQAKVNVELVQVLDSKQ